jgi:hypothetical protein
VYESRFGASKFSYETQRLARPLAACFPEDLELAGDIVKLLSPQDDEVLMQRMLDVRYTIVEILWKMIHARGGCPVRVDELAKDVNVVLRSYGETLEYSPEEIGWKLRELNIRRHSTSSGRQVLLGRETSHNVRRWARAYDLECPNGGKAGCPDCSPLQPPVSKKLM